MALVLNLEPLGYSEEAENLIGSSYVKGNPTMLHVLRPDVIITRLKYQITGEIMDEATNLRAIVTATTGLDHIDLEGARERGIEVLSLQGETEFLRSIPATAEHTWALLLALLRRIPWAFEDVKAGDWNRDKWRGSQLAGKRITVLGGEGRVGSQVRGYALAFGMQINNIDVGLLDMSSPMSDVLTVHLPLTDETRGLVGADILASTKYLINTSRGELVDEDALLEALVSGKLAGAALDVMAGERGPFMGLYGSYGLENLPLLCYARENQNLILTPHIAGATHEAMAATEVFMAKKLVAWLNA